MGGIPSLNIWCNTQECCNAYTCVSVVSGYRLECFRTLDSPGSHRIISHRIEGMTVQYSYNHCVLGLFIVLILCTLHVQYPAIDFVIKDPHRLDHEYIVYLLCRWNPTLHSYCWIIIARGLMRVFWEGGGGRKMSTFFHYKMFFRKIFLRSQNPCFFWGEGGGGSNNLKVFNYWILFFKKYSWFF